MSRTYRCKIKGDPGKFIARAKELARENGAEVKGDDRQGTVRVLGVTGDYLLKGKTAEITIRKKLVIYPWSLIEGQISRFFGCPVEKE